MTYRVSELASRDDLPRLLNQSDFYGQGVEVGTHRAEFARQLLLRWRCEKLFCVDPWANPPGYEKQAQTLWGGGDREADFIEAREVLSEFGERVEMVRATSVDAGASRLHAELPLLDFVYLDGDHSKPSITADLEIWIQLLKSGGVFAGHDIVCPGEPRGGWGEFIQPAVTKFAKELGVDIWLIVEPNNQPWSYYMIKP